MSLTATDRVHLLRSGPQLNSTSTERSLAPKHKIRRSMSHELSSSDSSRQSVDLQALLAPMSDDPTVDDDNFFCEEFFRLYRVECERWIHPPDPLQIEQEEYIQLLRTMVTNLLEQNECLIQNIVELRQESANRVTEMSRKLQQSAARTEEVMLALASHELQLKQFVERHCCSCCGCDMRLLEFKVCHNGQCQRDEPRGCCSYGHEWHSVVDQSTKWFATHQYQSNANCVHHLPSHIKFCNLVDSIDRRVHQLESENDELKKENQIIRELNSLFSQRKGPPLTIDNIVTHQVCKPMPWPNSASSSHSLDDHSPSLSPVFDSQCLMPQANRHHLPHQIAEGLIGFLNDTSKHEELLCYLEQRGDSLDSDSCTSRPESFSDHSARLDNDSGCSTELVRSQTDMHSLLLSSLPSDCEDDTEELVKSLLSSHPTHHCDQSSQLTAQGFLREGDSLHDKVGLAEQLVPKLYNKLLYYLNQRNLLLRQFCEENQARKKCKQELSTLTECLIEGLKDIEIKSIKKLNLTQTNSPY